MEMTITRKTRIRDKKQTGAMRSVWRGAPALCGQYNRHSTSVEAGMNLLVSYTGPLNYLIQIACVDLLREIASEVILPRKIIQDAWARYRVICQSGLCS